MAEERNQVELNAELDPDENEKNDEESKYGATDMRDQKAVSHQDGGVFGSMRSKSNKSSKKKTAPSDAGKGGLAGLKGKKKFTNFHSNVDKKALEKIKQ